MTKELKPNTKIGVQDTSNLAVALRAIDLIRSESSWCTGTKLNSRGQMCTTGAIYKALNVNIESKTFIPRPEQVTQLNTICQSLGFDNYGHAEEYNDRHQHHDVIGRLELGILNWEPSS